VSPESKSYPLIVVFHIKKSFVVIPVKYLTPPEVPLDEK
jgi:hypothetical protein